MVTQQQMWERLGTDVHVLVVGGGITGAGIARDAARRGLSVALVEMNDLAYGTSSRSSKLIHGGLRYLEHYEFSLVFEAISERRILLDLAPHLVNPLGFLFPVYEGSPHKLWFINVGMWLYDGLSLFRSPKVHKKLNPKQVAKHEPVLGQEGLKGAPLYYDCSTDDARLTLETALDSVGHGATIATRARLESFLKDEHGRVCGAVVKNELTGALKEVAANVVINATGPWTDRTIAMSQPQSHRLLRPTKGVHIVVEHERIPLETAVVCFHPTDGRVLFAIPWGEHTYLGTTDTDYSGDPGKVVADSDDVDYLINASNAYFPDHPIERAHVISTWAGLRPLMTAASSDPNMAESTVSREHQILVGQDGLITIAGGKLTTYRRMAAEVVDTAARMLQLSGNLAAELKPARTDKEPLPGAVGWPEDDDHEKVAAQVEEAAAGHLSRAAARHLGDHYGMRAVAIAELCAADPALATPLLPSRLEIFAQVDWAVQEELAATLSDFLMRRTQIFHRDRDQGLACVDVVADRMGALLGWDKQERERQVALFGEDVAACRRWKDG